MFSLRLLSSVRAIRSTSQTLRSLSSTQTLKCSQDVSVPSPPPESAEKSAKPETFAHMLRHSKFVQIGDPVGKVLQQNVKLIICITGSINVILGYTVEAAQCNH